MKKWKTTTALIMMVFAIVFDWQWFWIALIVLGILHALQTKTIHFVEETSRKESPLHYWILIIIWVGIAIFAVYEYILN